MSEELVDESNYDREIPSLNSGRSRNNPIVGILLVIGALGMVGYLFYLMTQNNAKEVNIEPPKEYQPSTVPKLKLPQEVIVIPKAPELPKSLEPLVANLEPVNANLPYIETEEDRLKRDELERQRLLAEQERIKKEKIAMRKMKGKVVSFSGNGSNDEIIGGEVDSSLDKYNIPEGLSTTDRLIAERNNLENELETLNRKKARVNNARRKQSRSPYFPDNSANRGNYNRASQRSNNQRPQQTTTNRVAQPKRTNTVAQSRKVNRVVEAPSIDAQIVRDSGYKILQGKVIGAILETAIQSDRGGRLRATSTEPVYSYNGERILLPLGSRFIGSYKGGVKQGQARISAIWDRVITPEGISINLASDSIGALGRAGTGGYIDSHFAERFGSSILLSIIGGLTATKDTDGTVKNSVKDGFNKSASIALENSIGIKPTLHKNQGTTIRIFVAHDFNLKNVYR